MPGSYRLARRSSDFGRFPTEGAVSATEAEDRNAERRSRSRHSNDHGEWTEPSEPNRSNPALERWADMVDWAVQIAPLPNWTTAAQVSSDSIASFSVSTAAQARAGRPKNRHMRSSS